MPEAEHGRVAHNAHDSPRFETSGFRLRPVRLHSQVMAADDQEDVLQHAIVRIPLSRAQREGRVVHREVMPNKDMLLTLDFVERHSSVSSITQESRPPSTSHPILTSPGL